MRIIRNLTSASLKGPCVATIGNFDGLHLGHQQMIKHTVARAKVLNLPATVITFEPLPAVFLRQCAIQRLSSFRQKAQLLAKLGIEQLVCIRFGSNLAQLKPTEFVEQYLIQCLKVKSLIVGEDFRFGAKQAGDVELLQCLAKHFNFEINVNQLLANGLGKISSSVIRQALLAGDFKLVTANLGRPFALNQRVVHGAKQGRVLGFPTANFILAPKNCVLKGVYITKVTHDQGTHFALTNVGVRPTVDGKHYLAETYILNFTGNLYGKYLSVAFLHKLRDEKRFINLDELTQQIHQDLHAAKLWLAKDQISLECEEYDQNGL